VGHSDERKHLYSATFGSTVDREVERSMSRQQADKLNDLLRTAIDDTVQQTIYYPNLSLQLKKAGFIDFAAQCAVLQTGAAANLNTLRNIQQRIRE